MNGIDGLLKGKDTTNITLQIDNNSRSEIVEIFYTIGKEDYKSRLARETFFGYFNPTDVYRDSSICAFDDSAKATFIVYDKADYDQIDLHITTKWKHEKDDRKDVITVSFKRATCKVLSTESQYIYHYQKVADEKNYFLLTVLHKCEHQKAEEAAVLNEYGETEMSARAYELASVCFRGAKSKIRDVPIEFFGQLLLDKIDINNRDAVQKNAKKTLKDHFEALKSYVITPDDEVLDESIEVARKAKKYALDHGTGRDDKVVKIFNLVDKALISYIQGKEVENTYLQYKTETATSSSTDTYYFNNAMEKANEGINLYKICKTSLEDCKTYWDEVDDNVDLITEANKLYTDKSDNFEAEVAAFVQKTNGTKANP